eukprot:PhF_6_TR4520/c0_g2_i2/m.6321
MLVAVTNTGSIRTYDLQSGAFRAIIPSLPQAIYIAAEFDDIGYFIPTFQQLTAMGWNDTSTPLWTFGGMTDIRVSFDKMNKTILYLCGNVNDGTDATVLRAVDRRTGGVLGSTTLPSFWGTPQLIGVDNGVVMVSYAESDDIQQAYFGKWQL